MGLKLELCSVIFLLAVQGCGLVSYVSNNISQDLRCTQCI